MTDDQTSGVRKMGRSLARRAADRSGLLARRLRWPLPWRAPYLRNRLDLVRPGQLGDVLLCTPTLRRIKRVNPRCRVVFYTNHGRLLRGLPYIDEIREAAERPDDAIYLGYEHRIPPRRHIATIIGENVGLRVADTRPDCHVDPALVGRYRASWAALPRPHVLINRHASGWTPNKDWPDELWDELIERLTRRGTVIEIGTASGDGPAIASPNYVDLIGRTSLDELVAAVAAADVHVGPVSAPVHIATAVGTPAVVIYGGFESPACSGYAANVNLATRLPCSPCWLREPCPINRECLRRIPPATVEAEIDRLWRRPRSSATPAV